MTMPYTDAAVDAFVAACRDTHDFSGWLADALCRAAAKCGGIDTLTAGRPGSWEAARVRELLYGTAGDTDYFLEAYRHE